MLKNLAQLDLRRAHVVEMRFGRSTFERPPGLSSGQRDELVAQLQADSDAANPCVCRRRPGGGARTDHSAGADLRRTQSLRSVSAGRLAGASGTRAEHRVLDDENGRRLSVAGDSRGRGALRRRPFHRVRSDQHPGDWGTVIAAIVEHDAGAVWLAPNNGGLVRFANGSFARFTTADGLVDDHPRALLRGSHGDLWIGAVAGLTRLGHGRFTIVGQGHDLPDPFVTALAENDDGGEISARARTLLVEVHQLASAYGWSEREILSLAPERRAPYLAMVAPNRAAV